ncbi:MAG: polyprenyl synthetase family protein [Planctomycetota bacterium]|nr:polyprenyl synthetase family protein [Planctomycetota bacterium]
MATTLTSTDSSFRSWLTSVGPEINAALAGAVAENSLPSAPKRLREAMAHALLSGGKRIRPALSLLAAEACGSDRARAMPGAVACEMIHAYSLVHDDLPCMDDDTLRRGKPTTHVTFGEATAVLAGDALQTLAFEILAQQSSAALAVEQIQLLTAASGASGMVGGQQMDMDGEGQQLSLEAILQMHAGKTGALLGTSILLGVASAGADLTPWRSYAASIGRLFQISDDVLDATRSTAELGKTAGKDLAADKSTVVGALGLDGARALMAEEVQNALNAVAKMNPVQHHAELADLPVFLGTRHA